MTDVPHILMVEDTESDIELIRQVLREMKIHHSIAVVRDGDSAISYVSREGQYHSERRPSLILLDLNLPGLSGFEVLTYLKSHPSYRSIPTVIFTSSEDQEDVARAYANYANSYINKPIDLDSLMNVISSLEKYWLSTVELPKR